MVRGICIFLVNRIHKRRELPDSTGRTQAETYKERIQIVPVTLGYEWGRAGKDK